MKQMYLLVATFLCCSMSFLAQRPENVYAIQALQSNKNTVSTVSKKSAPAISRNSSKTSRSCDDYYTVHFDIDKDSLITKYNYAKV